MPSETAVAAEESLAFAHSANRGALVHSARTEKTPPGMGGVLLAFIVRRQCLEQGMAKVFSPSTSQVRGPA